MKLRNKKTGEIWDIGKVLVNDYPCWETLTQICEDWEDVKVPLIKDEKIRKAIRAWAKMNDIRFIHMCSREDKRNARIVGQNAVGRTFTMEINDEYDVRVSFGDYKECYTIAELCGERNE